MKRIFCILLIAAVSMAAVSCKKEGSFNPKEKIVAVYQQQTSVTGAETTTVEKYKAEDWVWEGKLLKEVISYYEDGTVLSHELMSYKGGRLVKVAYEGGDTYTEYTYKSGKLTRIAMVSDGEETFAADVEHDGSNISKMKMSIDIPDSMTAKFAERSLARVIPQQLASLLIPTLTMVQRDNQAEKQSMAISINFTYTDKNLTKMAVVVSGFTIMTVTCTYDDMKNPMQGCFAMLSPSTLSKNNIVETKMKLSGLLSQAGGMMNSMEGLPLPGNQKCSYTYTASDFPETMTTTSTITEDDVTTTTTSTTFYEYGD